VADRVIRPDEEVVLVDRDDNAIGRCEKLTAHRSPGVLHRGFSVLLYDDRAHLLLQRRAATKYHFGAQWSNSCCGHPRPGEKVSYAAARRVQEELGVSVDVVPASRFEYRAEDPHSGLVEHEIDHVLRGTITDALLQPDPTEIDDWCWVDQSVLDSWMTSQPTDFTPWFALVVRAGAWPTSVHK
jgi:isopentenyl-diphosphate Delta-isomerase